MLAKKYFQKLQVNIKPKNTLNFFKFPKNNLIELKSKRKSIFQQAHFNPYHIPPRQQKNIFQEKFTDPDYKWDNIPSPCKEKGSELIAVLEAEELNKIKSQGLKKDKIGLGDKIEVEYYHSITSKKLYKYRGTVLGFCEPNSIKHTFKFLSLIAGSYVLLDYPYHSPMLHSIKVSSKGNFNGKSKIYNLRKIGQFGLRLDELMQGGKRTNLTKQQNKNIKKVDNLKEQIVYSK